MELEAALLTERDCSDKEEIETEETKKEKIKDKKGGEDMKGWKKQWAIIAVVVAVIVALSAMTAAENGKKKGNNILAADFFSEIGISKDSVKSITFLDSFEQMPEANCDVSLDKDGSVRAWGMNRAAGYYDLFIAGDGGVSASPSGCQEMFYDCQNLQQIDLSGFDTSQVTDMDEMFAGCTNLESR